MLDEVFSVGDSIPWLTMSFEQDIKKQVTLNSICGVVKGKTCPFKMINQRVGKRAIHQMVSTKSTSWSLHTDPKPIL